MAPTFNSFTRTLNQLIKAIDDEGPMGLRIPQHQRHPVVWKLEDRQTLVDSIKKNMPTPSILIYTDPFRQEWLEDGLQRVTTLKDFCLDRFVDLQGNLYSAWTEIEKHKFMNYTIPIVWYCDATEEDRVEVFDRFQNGSQLEPGERLHAHSHTILVKFTKEMLMKYTNSSGNEVAGLFYERAKNVWGDIKCNDAEGRYAELLIFVALINGIVHGWSSDPNGSKGITKKYDNLRKTLLTNINSNMRENAERILDELLTIYEEASEKKPLKPKKFKTESKAIGNFTGAIVWSLKTMPNDWARLHTMWVDFIVSYRNDCTLLKTTIKDGVAKCRNWSAERWEKTYNDVLNPPPPVGSTTHSHYDSACEESEDYDE
jgi:hypothetical protein